MLVNIIKKNIGIGNKNGTSINNITTTKSSPAMLPNGLSNLAVDVMGKEGKPYLPIVFGIGLYVAVSNLMGLIPGLIPPTSNMNTTAAPAIFVFLLYNFIGIKKHGASYIKHF